MANLSQIRRKKMLEFLETLKEQHTDDASLIAINQIGRSGCENADTYSCLYGSGGQGDCR